MFIRVAYENAQRGGIIHGENPKQKGHIKMNRVHLILVDGMRADSLAACGNPFVNELLE